MTPEIILTWSIAVFLVAIPLGLVFVNTAIWWRKAHQHGLNLRFMYLAGMHFRKVPPQFIVEGQIALKAIGIDVASEILEAHLIRGGNLEKTIAAVVAAKENGGSLSFDRAAELDAEGKDVLEMVQTGGAGSE